MEAIKILEKAYFESGYEIKAMLRALFTSDFFKSEDVRFAKVKSPADVVIGIMHIAQALYDTPGDALLAAQSIQGRDGVLPLTMEIKYMGMELLNPPTVEGWHMGSEWINSGSLVDRVNFATKMLSNTELPGVRSMIARLMAQGETLSPEQLVDGCLDLLGPMTLPDDTYEELVTHVAQGGELRHGTEAEKAEFTRRASQMLQMVASTSEFQFG